MKILSVAIPSYNSENYFEKMRGVITSGWR